MKFLSAELAGVMLIEPEIHGDARGYFMEVFHEKRYAEAGIAGRFVQDNQSHSKKGVLRGLHYQAGKEQGKLIRVLQGEIFDVTVDIRPGSKTFGKWMGVKLTGIEPRMLWIPKGFAHGFYTLSETADVAYKVTEFYAPQNDRTLLWNDPDVAVRWPLQGEPVLSEKDRAGHSLKTVTTLGQISRPNKF